MPERAVIGRNTPRVDGRERVTGSAIYGVDKQLPGMLWAKVKRSPLPFARVVAINTKRAEAMPGVKAVITGRDIKQFRYGPSGEEQALADEYVRFIGDAVAAVAAVDENTAEDALELIDVEYKELTPVLDMEQAMQPGAPAVHPEKAVIKNNVASHIDYVRGKGKAAFNEADVIVEGRFSTQISHHAYMEPISATVDWTDPEKVTMWGSLQRPFDAREQMARALGVPESDVRVLICFMGGGFGARAGVLPNLYPIAALLSRKTRRPVKMVLSRTEDFTTARPRIPERINIRVGFKKDGTLVGTDIDILADAGAFAGLCSGVLGVSATRTGSLYRTPNITMNANLVYTNTIPRGPYRGFGNEQMHFAMESMMDEAARKLGMDPVDIRLKNATRKGDITAHGWVINTCALSEAIEAAAAASKWREKRQRKVPNRGIGMACQVHVSGNRGTIPLYDGSAAIVRIDEHGKALIIGGEIDLGQGSNTTYCQIAAEELGLPVKDVAIAPFDTALSPYCQGTFADRATVVGGNAVLKAAQAAREQLVGFAAELLKARAEDIQIKGAKVYDRKSPEKQITVREVAHHAMFARAGLPITGMGHFLVPLPFPDHKTRYGNVSVDYPFSSQVIELQVDPETGKVEVLHAWMGHDIGKVLNPMSAEGQVEGGIVQGIGYALDECYLLKEGRVLNPNFADYKIPLAPDTPPIDSIFIETEEAPGANAGPYGAKGVGEPASVPTAPAVANAIYDAIGIRFKDLPITSEKILKALNEKQKENHRAGK